MTSVKFINTGTPPPQATDGELVYRRNPRPRDGHASRWTTLGAAATSSLLATGVSIEVVGQRLGHSGIGIIVDRYLTIYKERDTPPHQRFGGPRPDPRSEDLPLRLLHTRSSGSL
jgi:hypothetical protein